MVMVSNRTEPPWQPSLDDGTSAAALRVALSVAERMREPSQIEAAVLETKLQLAGVEAPPWRPYGLGHRYAGSPSSTGSSPTRSLRPGQGWDGLAHQYIEIAAHRAAAGVEGKRPSTEALGCLSPPAYLLTRPGERYQRLPGDTGFGAHREREAA